MLMAVCRVTALSLVMLTALMISARAHALVQTRFTFAVPASIETLDPHLTSGPEQAAARVNLYDGLMRWQDNPARLEPWLAEAHTVSPDGLTYTFTLRKGARFHDGGEVKATDVVYSMERLLALKRGTAPLFASLLAPGSTKTTGDHTVEFNLIRPAATFLALLPELAIVNAAIVKKHEVNNDWGQGWLAKNAAGSGSYSLARLDPAGGFTASRFAEHWNPKWAKKPIAEIEFRTVADAEARVTGLVAGEYQGSAGHLTDEQVKRLKENATIRVAEAETPNALYALLNANREPLSNINLRRAIAAAFDYEGLAKSNFAAIATRNPSPLPGTIMGAPKGARGAVFNIERARDLVNKLGDPLREITIAALIDQPRADVAAAHLQGNLEKAGIRSRLVFETEASLAAKQRDGRKKYDILLKWRGPVYLDPHNWLGELFVCDAAGAANTSYYCNREVDKLLAEAHAIIDPEQRRRLYERAATMLMEDTAALFIYTARWRGAFAKGVTGIRYNPMSEAQEMRWVSLE